MRRTTRYITVGPVETPQQRLGVYLRTLYVYLVQLPLAVESATVTLRSFNPDLMINVAPPEGVTSGSEYDMSEVAALAQRNKEAFDELIAAFREAQEGGIIEWVKGAQETGSRKRSETL